MTAKLRRALTAFARTTRHTGNPGTAWKLCIAQRGTSDVRLPGYPGSFRIRCGTTDAQFIRALANDDYPPEYALPANLNPRVIFDIGANIGGVAAAMLKKWPDARLYAFEPLADNVALLRHNLRAYANVSVQPYGLGNRTETLTYERSDDERNFGGGGFHGAQADPNRLVSDVPVVAVPEALETLGIDTIDVIKVDTEGAEHAILTSFPTAVLSRVKAIVGELHGKPGDGELLEYLAQWFTLEVQYRASTGQPHYFRALAHSQPTTACETAAAEFCPA